MPDEKVVIPDISDEQAAETVEQLPDILEQVKAGRTPDLPGFEFEAPAQAPPQLLELLRNRETETPCGGAFTIQWTGGPWKGLPMTAFCQVPGCLNTPERVCTGPMFVPSYKQYTKIDADDPMFRERQPSVEEIMAAVDLASRKAAAITGVSDHRSQKERARHVGETWAAIKRSMQGAGGWGM